MDAGIPARGALAQRPLPRLLVDLHLARWTGALDLARERTRKRIVLRDGAPILAESNLASESLGVLLLDRGQLMREDYARVVARVQETGCKEGKALLDLHLLDPKALFVALKEQLRRRVLECFAWPSGDYTLDAREAPPADAAAFRLDTPALVLEGITLHWTADRLLADLADRLPRRVAPSRVFDRMRARLASDPGAAALASALDGAPSLAEAVRLAGHPSALAAAWLFDAAGCLETLADEMAPAEGAPDGPHSTGSDAVIDVVFADERARDHAEASPAEVRATSGAPEAGAESLRAEIVDRHSRLSELDHYALLDVPRDADAAAIKRAYFGAAKRYHPDALARLGLADVRSAAEALFARIAKAHAVLSDPRERQRYDEEGREAGSDDAERVVTAENLYRKGEILLRKGSFREALQFLAPAVDLWPSDAAYRAALGWALYKQTKSDPAAARDHLEAAAALDATSAVTFYRLGAVLRALGNAAAADEAFRRARALDPKGSAA